MKPTHVLLCVLLCLSACAPRGVLDFAPAGADGTLRNVWVANYRPTLPPAKRNLGPPRPEALRFEKYTVSVPPVHETGVIAWPGSERPDPALHFVTTDQQNFANAGAFKSALVASDTSGEDEILLFVHGYNVNHAEAVYQLAQVAHDYEVPVPAVLFSWPSAGRAAGYLFDRDSVLFARDQLEETIEQLVRVSGRKLVIMGHSMGSFLIMETLRQIEISGSFDVQRNIEAVFLISPDIDGELFVAQAKRMRALPEPFVVVAVEQDRALRVSALLTGRENRLGSDINRTSVGDLPISVLDVSELADGGLQHSVALSSPAAIAVLKRLDSGRPISQRRFTGLHRFNREDFGER